MFLSLFCDIQIEYELLELSLERPHQQKTQNVAATRDQLCTLCAPKTLPRVHDGAPLEILQAPSKTGELTMARRQHCLRLADVCP